MVPRLLRSLSLVNIILLPLLWFSLTGSRQNYPVTSGTACFLVSKGLTPSFFVETLLPILELV
uniref:Uncharacterized protein n=1 Tax=Utricularia reniformis TaxID=192314 RepID=A0A1Y0AZ82_9LAMI|nr:hypothetical protein AEK19_MT0214 [Utricularia reniformis]ART30492.1 hypothetical protein AEK19_MT0214 [Utricularia reniformis]